MINKESRAIIELVLPEGAINFDFLAEEVKAFGVASDHILKWNNRAILTKIKLDKADSITKKLKALGKGEVHFFSEVFFEFDRSWCDDKTVTTDVKEIYLSTNLVKDKEKQKEYIRLHREQPTIWTELSQGFCKEGFQYVTMYQNGRQIMMVGGYPSDRDIAQMSANNAKNNPKVTEWDALMLNFQEGLLGTEEGVKWVVFE